MSSTRIRDAEARLVRIPVTPPAADASNCFDTQEVILCRITDESGNRGTGFGYTIGRGGSTILELLRRELLPRLAGRDARAIARIGRELRAAIHTISGGTIPLNALAAIDVALWDLAGRRTGQPVAMLLGGTRDRVPVYNTDVGWLNRPLDELVERCREATHDGKFRAVKLKIGKPDPEEDVERVAKVRAAVGRHVAIFSDANQAWRVDEAVQRARLLEPFGVGWLEEPIDTAFAQDYAVLRRHTAIPIAGGESLSTPGDFFEFARHRTFDILQPDVARLGGITQAMAVCGLAASAGMPVAPHVSPELSLVVAAAAPTAFYIEYVPQMEPILSQGIRIENGHALLPDRPGLGFEYDEEALNRYEVKPHALAA